MAGLAGEEGRSHGLTEPFTAEAFKAVPGAYASSSIRFECERCGGLFPESEGCADDDEHICDNCWAEACGEGERGAA